MADFHLSRRAEPAGAPPRDPVRCSYCGKDQSEVEAIVAGWTPSLAICNECVDLCAEIMAEQRAPGDPPGPAAPGSAA